jgi:hypothetical protein
MKIFLTNGRPSMKLKIKLNFDEYFAFLEEYFEMFKDKITQKRKKITGNKFLL